jgi:hypothetical protein
MRKIYEYRYTDEDDKPLTSCPECGGDLTAEGGIDLDLVIAGRPMEGIPTRLDSDGGLVDVDWQVATGHHGATNCGHCGEMLINMEGAVEICEEAPRR